jgi:SAM-dependent methyltransferase
MPLCVNKGEVMRDTDEDWVLYGQFEPYYGVLTHDRFLRANITPEARDEFWNSGRVDIARIMGEITRLFGKRDFKNALDFGCGVGRLVHGIADIADRVVGIDVSSPMIEEASLHAPCNAVFMRHLPDDAFDWINSYIVFQHIPPDRGYQILEDLLERAAEQCVLSLHFTLFKDDRALNSQGISRIRFGTTQDGACHPLVRHKLGRFMEMYDYDLTMLFGLLVAHRFNNVYLEHTDHGGAHGATIYAAR